MSWQPMDTAPKNGSTVILKAVWGPEPDDGEVSFEGKAQWRTERRPATISPLDGIIADAHDSTGWMRADCDKRVPGRAVAWKNP